MRHILGVPEHDDDLDDLLRALPDPPLAWIASAEEIPLLMQAADEAEGDDPASLRAALASVGLDSDDDHVRALQRVIRRR
jgi:hypothetical protein